MIWLDRSAYGQDEARLAEAVTEQLRETYPVIIYLEIKRKTER